jgi:hypothetical protein
MFQWERRGLASSSNKVEKDEMGGACNTHGRDEHCIQNSGRET